MKESSRIDWLEEGLYLLRSYPIARFTSSENIDGGRSDMMCCMQLQKLLDFLFPIKDEEMSVINTALEATAWLNCILIRNLLVLEDGCVLEIMGLGEEGSQREGFDLYHLERRKGQEFYRKCKINP